MRRIVLNTLWLGLALGLPLATACSAEGPSQEEITVKFDEVLAEAKVCEIDPENPPLANPCVIVYPGCPLGQFEAVNRDKAAAVDEAARALLRQYAVEGPVCGYRVLGVTAPEAECRDGECVVTEIPEPKEPDAGE